MKIRNILLSLLISIGVLAAANASASGSYTVICPYAGYTAFALQVLPAGSSQSATGAGVSLVIPGLNALIATGDLDGSVLLMPVYNNNNPCPTGYIQREIDSSSATGWSLGAPEPILTLGQGVYFNNQSGSSQPLSLTFSGDVKAVEPPQSVIQGHWYLRGRQIPSDTVNNTSFTFINPVNSWHDLMASSEPAFPVSIYPVDIVGGAIHFLPCQTPVPAPLATWDGAVWNPPFPTAAQSGLGVAGNTVWIGPFSSAIISGHVYFEQLPNPPNPTCSSHTPLPNWTVRLFREWE